MQALWPHQRRGIDTFMQLSESGPHSTCVTSPTGGGKSVMMSELIRRFPSAVLYTNRRLLTEQLMGVLRREGISFGVRASGFDDDMRMLSPVQISSMPTEAQRVYKRNSWRLHDAKLVIVDEAHLQRGGTSEKILQDHKATGATIAGFTATPLNVSHLYDNLVVAGTNSELRDCGAHVMCETYTPSEMDTDLIKPTVSGEYREGDIVKKLWTPAVFGNVLEHYRTLNPDRRHAICCCPSVATSVWMADQFTQNGVRAASLDGEEIVMDGSRLKSDRQTRALLMARFDAGEIDVITFRYVLREAWDFPKLYHMILATPIGSLTSYLQVVGRVLRKHPTLERVILQDHGGNYRRHGSPNANQKWDELWKVKPAAITNAREERMREKPDEQPITCPKCFATRLRGVFCHHCGTESSKRMRMIIQHNGSLKRVEGDCYKPQPVKQKPNTQALWDRMFYRARNAGMTFRQARGLFYREHGYYPPKQLKLMPKNEFDWYQPVKAVAVGQLQ